MSTGILLTEHPVGRFDPDADVFELEVRGGLGVLDR